MPLTTSIFNNVLQSSGFTAEERLVREALQNSVDARREAAEAPVAVRIERLSVTGSEKAKLVSALRLADEPLGRQTHFGLPSGNALETITDDDVPLSLLIISDFNTKGLGGNFGGTGDDDHFGRLVINLGVDDKADASSVSGGSFGFGKTVYGKASKIGVVAFYSVFQPTEASDGAHARFMATGLFSAHDHSGTSYDGFAFFGAPDPDHPDEAIPFVDSDAHAVAASCGIPARPADEHGTSIIIVDCDYDMEALKRASELYWWPRLIRDELDLTLIAEGVRTPAMLSP